LNSRKAFLRIFVSVSKFRDLAVTVTVALLVVLFLVKMLQGCGQAVRGFMAILLIYDALDRAPVRRFGCCC
jgi:hypothetical protein